MSYPKVHPAIDAYNRVRRAFPQSDLDGSLLLDQVSTWKIRREINGADSPDLIDSLCASMVTWAGPAGVVEERRDGTLVDTGKPRHWHPALPEVLVYRREPQANGHICAKVKESAPRFRPIFELSFVLLLSLLLPLAAHAQPAAPCRVNVTTCAAAECSLLPGIGPSKGAAIEAAHPADEAALDAVPGIGEKTLEKLRPFLAYGTERTTCTSKQTAPKPEATDKDGAQ